MKKKAFVSTRILTASAVVLCGMLTGCGQLVSGGGMPDEMAVVSGPPLTLPPNFELRPPAEQKASKAEALRARDSGAEAQQILMGESGGKTAKGSSWLLEQSGADQADPNIRQDLESAEE